LTRLSSICPKARRIGEKNDDGIGSACHARRSRGAPRRAPTFQLLRVCCYARMRACACAYAHVYRYALLRFARVHTYARTYVHTYIRTYVRTYVRDTRARQRGSHAPCDHRRRRQNRFAAKSGDWTSRIYLRLAFLSTLNGGPLKGRAASGVSAGVGAAGAETAAVT